MSSSAEALAKEMARDFETKMTDALRRVNAGRAANDVGQYEDAFKIYAAVVRDLFELYVKYGRYMDEGTLLTLRQTTQLFLRLGQIAAMGHSIEIPVVTASRTQLQEKMNAVIREATEGTGAAGAEKFTFVEPADLRGESFDAGWSESRVFATIAAEVFENFIAQDRPGMAAFLLYGPPGSGKTTIASALAKQFNATMMRVQANTVFDKWLGGSEAKVGEIFVAARKRADASYTDKMYKHPTFIFIDEAESIFADRNQEGGAQTSVPQMLLAFMDGSLSETADRQRLIMCCSTNYADKLDKAFLRRFNKIFVGYPQMPQEYRDLIRKHLARRIRRELTAAERDDMDRVFDDSFVDAHLALKSPAAIIRLTDRHFSLVSARKTFLCPLANGGDEASYRMEENARDGSCVPISDRLWEPGRALNLVHDLPDMRELSETFKKYTHEDITIEDYRSYQLQIDPNQRDARDTIAPQIHQQ